MTITVCSRIRHRDGDDRYPKELFRYDQVASYEPYLEESDPEEEGKPKQFNECGVDITLVDTIGEIDPNRQGLRPHPYITETIRVCVNDQDRHRGELEVNQIIAHFDYIFGVRDDEAALFGFGATKQQCRDSDALYAMGGMLAAAMQSAQTGGISEEVKEQFAEAKEKAEDATTRGLAKYTRLADEAEAKIQ